jgi:hypothetical protein
MPNRKTGSAYRLELLGHCLLLSMAAYGCSHPWDALARRAAQSEGGAGGESTLERTSTRSSGGSGASGSGDGGGSAGVGVNAITRCFPQNSIAGLRDDFDGLQLDPGWEIYGSSSVPIKPLDGELTLDAIDDSPNRWGAIRTFSTYDLRDCAVSIRLVEPFDSRSVAYVYLEAYNALNASIGFGEKFGFLEILWRLAEEPNATEVALIPYNPVDHAYLRIRESAGIAYWEASTDGADWRTLHKETHQSDLSSVRFSIGAGTIPTPGVELPGVARLDSLNIFP